MRQGTGSPTLGPSALRGEGTTQEGSCAVTSRPGLKMEPCWGRRENTWSRRVGGEAGELRCTGSGGGREGEKQEWEMDVRNPAIFLAGQSAPSALP